MATAFWVEAPASGALREEPVADPQADEVRVRTLYTGVSRGTESLVFRGEVPESEFDSEFQVGGGFGAIHQPGTSQTLDPLLEVPMVPISYRNFGAYEVLAGNHVTRLADDTTDNIAGVRWFELRRTGGPASDWTLFQQGTFAPADTGGQISRWMAALGMDESGNIAMGYSVSRDPGVFPGLRYVGREATDPPGVMTTAAGPDARDPQPVGITAGRLAAELGWRPGLVEGDLRGRWAEIIGAEIAEHCRPDTFDGGLLTLRATSTAWAANLTLLTPQLLRRLGEELGEGVVVEVRVVGPSGPGFGRGRRSVPGRGPRDTWG